MWRILCDILSIPRNIVMDMNNVIFDLLELSVFNMLESLRIVKKCLYTITHSVGLRNNLLVHHQTNNTPVTLQHYNIIPWISCTQL